MLVKEEFYLVEGMRYAKLAQVFGEPEDITY